MSRQIVPSSGLVRRQSPATRRCLLSRFLPAMLLVGCASGADQHVERSEIGRVLSNPAAYDGVLIHAEVCVGVAIEGMYLLECGTREPVVDFTAGESADSKRAVEKLIDLGHSMMGEEPDKIRVLVEGIYRHSAGKSRFDHTIELRSFKRIKS